MKWGIMIEISILVVLLIVLIICWKIPFSLQKSGFIAKMEERIGNTETAEGVCTRKEINNLPDALIRFCDYIGLEGTQKHNSVRCIFKDTDFVFDASKGVKLKMDYDLWLFAEEWYRSAYCTSTMYGIPFEGQDYVSDNKKAGMKGYLGKCIKIFETEDEESYRAGLISWMIEGAILNPSFLLSDYIAYEEIDSNHVKATITYNKVSGSGIFTISDEGAITEFYSDERQIEMINGKKVSIGWRCEAENYIEKDGMLMPKTIRSIKVFPDKEVIYFDADEYEITYMN